MRCHGGRYRLIILFSFLTRDTACSWILPVTLSSHCRCPALYGLLPFSVLMSVRGGFSPRITVITHNLFCCCWMTDSWMNSCSLSSLRSPAGRTHKWPCTGQVVCGQAEREGQVDILCLESTDPLGITIFKPWFFSEALLPYWYSLSENYEWVAW